MSTSTLILSVTELTRAIKYKLEAEFPKICVQGEVSNFKKQASGHLYFTLKDAQAQIQCVMFLSDARALRRLPAIGDQIQVIGEINVYPPRGNYQIIVRQLKASGLGQLLMMLEERKAKYLSRGWFESSLKKRIPRSPQTIGVITSPTGAVIQDILHVLKRRAPKFHLLLNPVKVQGEGAKDEITKAIDSFNEHHLADVLIVARGGGSMEDLWPFNEECVVESIHRSEIPVVAAIGHETDTTLADLVADLRAPTPSAAAEMVSLDKVELQLQLNNCQVRAYRLLKQQLLARNEKLNSILHHPFLKHPDRLLNIFQQKLDESNYKLNYQMGIWSKKVQNRLNQLTLKWQSQNPSLKVQKAQKQASDFQSQIDHLLKNKLKQAQQRLSMLQEKIDRAFDSYVQRKKSNFNQIWTHLKAIHPQKLLEKGYSILFDEKEKSVILSTQDIALNQSVQVRLKDGSMTACVTAIEQDKE